MFRITAPGLDCLKGTPIRARQVALDALNRAHVPPEHPLHDKLARWNPHVSLDLQIDPEHFAIRIMPCTPPISNA